MIFKVAKSIVKIPRVFKTLGIWHSRDMAFGITVIRDLDVLIRWRLKSEREFSKSNSLRYTVFVKYSFTRVNCGFPKTASLDN